MKLFRFSQFWFVGKATFRLVLISNIHSKWKFYSTFVSLDKHSKAADLPGLLKKWNPCQPVGKHFILKLGEIDKHLQSYTNLRSDLSFRLLGGKWLLQWRCCHTSSLSSPWAQSLRGQLEQPFLLCGQGFLIWTADNHTQVSHFWEPHPYKHEKLNL